MNIPLSHVTFLSIFFKHTIFLWISVSKPAPIEAEKLVVGYSL